MSHTSSLILSICIPSYNRFNSLLKLVNSILKCNSDGYEIVIVDNGSEKNIKNYIEQSSKVRIVQRDKPISGILNPRDSLNYGKGKYRLVCLDKDFIDGSKLSWLINTLKTGNNLTGGYCALNKENSCINSVYNKKDFCKIAYNIRHPSGTFVRDDILLEDNKAVDYLNPNCFYFNFPFLTDILVSRCLLYGNVLEYNRPLFRTETLTEASNKQTYSYNASNLFFYPKQRYIQFEVFLENLFSYKIDKWVQNLTIQKLCNNLYFLCTYGYRDILNNKAICQHYCIKSFDMSDAQLKEEIKKCDNYLISSDDNIIDLKYKKKLIKNAKVYLFLVKLKRKIK